MISLVYSAFRVDVFLTVRAVGAGTGDDNARLHIGSIGTTRSDVVENARSCNRSLRCQPCIQATSCTRCQLWCCDSRVAEAERTQRSPESRSHEGRELLLFVSLSWVPRQPFIFLGITTNLASVGLRSSFTRGPWTTGGWKKAVTRRSTGFRDR